MNPILTLAVKAARRGGQIALRYMGRIEQAAAQPKGRHDAVSGVGRMALEDIVETVHYLHPNHRIVAEGYDDQSAAAVTVTDSAAAVAEPTTTDSATAVTEPTAADSAVPEPPTAELTATDSAAHPAPPTTNPTPTTPDDAFEWIIAPLDGTINYLHGHPQFAVSIAVRHNRRVQHAVIFDPLRDELYTASRGQGAQLNSRRMRVTRQPRLARSLLASGFGFRQPKDFDLWLSSLAALLPQVTDVRRCGSAALDLAYLACGRLDGYWQPGLEAWNIAAGSLLVREAGGLVADFQGRQHYLETGNIIAANDLIFNDLLMIIKAKAGLIQ